MQNRIAGILLLTVFLFVPAVFGADTLDQFVGTWGSKESNAVYQITKAGNSLQIRAVDMTDGEEFVIEDIQVLDGELFFTSIMPSTKWTVHHHVLPLNGNELQIFRSGDSTKGGKLIRQE